MKFSAVLTSSPQGYVMPLRISQIEKKPMAVSRFASGGKISGGIYRYDSLSPQEGFQRYICLVRAGFFLVLLLSIPSLAQRYIRMGLSVPHTSRIPPYGATSRSYGGFVGGITFHREWTQRTSFRT